MEQFWDAKCGLYQLKRIGNHNVLFVRSKIDAYPNWHHSSHFAILKNNDTGSSCLYRVVEALVVYLYFKTTVI